MRKKSFTQNRSSGWLSTLGRSALLVILTLCCLGQAQAQVPLTGSGATIATGFDPCECSGIPGCFFDEVTVLSPTSGDVWQITGAAPGNHGTITPFLRDVVFDANGNIIGLPTSATNATLVEVGPIVSGGATLIEYTLEVLICNQSSDVVAAGGTANDFTTGTSMVTQLSPTGVVSVVANPKANDPSVAAFSVSIVNQNAGLSDPSSSITLITGGACFEEVKPVVLFTPTGGMPDNPVDPNSGATIPCLDVDMNGTIGVGISALGTGLLPGSNANNGSFDILLNGAIIQSGTITNGTMNSSAVVSPVTPIDVLNDLLSSCNLTPGKQTLTFNYDAGMSGNSKISEDPTAAIAGTSFLFSADGLRDGMNNAGMTTCTPFTCDAQFDIDFCPLPGDQPLMIFDLGGTDVNGSIYAPENQVHRITICPNDPDNPAVSNNKSLLRFEFDPTDFNIASGDTVRIYDGVSCADPVLLTDFNGINGGNGLNGGWLDASCNNASGCLTFEFSPKNDTRKSSYKLSYRKMPRPTTITCPADATLTGICQDGIQSFGTISDSDGDGIITVADVVNVNSTAVSDITSTFTIPTLNADCGHTPQILAINVTGPFTTFATPPFGGVGVGVGPAANPSQTLQFVPAMAPLDANGNPTFMNPGFQFSLPKGAWTFEYIYMDPNPTAGEVADFVLANVTSTAPDQFDLNCDGVGDGLIVDINGNGNIDEGNYIDFNNNGFPDVGEFIDSNGNGVFEAGDDGFAGPSFFFIAIPGDVFHPNICQSFAFFSTPSIGNGFIDNNGNGIADDGSIPLMQADTCAQIVTVVPPPPVCNDRINVSLGLNCSTQITPDMVLEAPCQNIAVGSPGNILYRVRIDENGDGFDANDNNIISTCGVVLYEVTTFMDMPDADGNFNGVIDAGDMLVGSCWGEINAEDNNPITVNARVKTLADRQNDQAAACALVPALQATLVIEQDSADWDVAAVAIAANIAANAAAALAVKPDNAALIAADSTAQADLDSAMVTMTASAAEVAAIQAQITAAQANCTNLTNLLGSTNGLLIACAADEITDAQILDQIVVDTLGSCGTISFSHTITPNFGDECGNSGGNSITVVINGTKVCGGKSTTGSATVTIPVVRPLPVSPIDTLIDCGISISPDVTGFPVLDMNGNGMADDGEPTIGLDDYNCSFIADFSDEEFASCGQGRKIFRTWRVLDWCPNPPAITTFSQLIEVQDTFPPVLTCVTDDEAGGVNNPHIFSTDEDQCGTMVSLTAPEVTDACDGSADAVMISVRNAMDSTLVDPDMPNAGLDTLNPLGCGTYFATYQATDACGNVSDTCNVFFNVVDDVQPTAICRDQLNVTLNSSGSAIISAASIDAGSSDNCGIDTLLIRVMDSGDDFTEL